MGRLIIEHRVRIALTPGDIEYPAVAQAEEYAVPVAHQVRVDIDDVSGAKTVEFLLRSRFRNAQAPAHDEPFFHRDLALALQRCGVERFIHFERIEDFCWHVHLPSATRS